MAEYLAGTINTTDPSQYGGACNLGSLFLHNFVKNPFTKQAHLDTDALRNTISIAVRMLDDIIDVNKFPDKIYENYQKGMRTIGIGITGLADMLAMLGVKYDSQEARDYIESLMKMITNAEYYASVQLAKEKGCFPLCELDKHVDGAYVESVLEHDVIAAMSEYGIRNAKIQAVAPCGTISMVFGNNCSSGIEPIFSLSYDRKVKIGGQDDKDVKIVKMMDYAYYLYHKLKDEGKQLDFDEHDIFPTALNMSVDDHVAMLAIISKYTDMSVSKTINVPTEASFDEVKDIYMQCWKKGIKGCTIFRPNAIRQGVLLTEDKKDDESKPEHPSLTLPRGSIIEPSNDLIGKKRKIQTGCGSLHVLAFFDPIDGNLQEVYFNKGSAGGCVDKDTEYFNGVEWKKISEYNADEYEQVLQYNEDGTASLTYPISYIVNDNIENLKHFHNTTGLDMVLSEDHRMYLYKNYIKYMSVIRSKLSTEIITVKDFLLGSRNRHVPTTFSMNTNGIPLDNNLIRLLVAIYADGTFDGHKIVVNVKKERKKIRLRHLLTNCDIGWTEKNIHNTEYTVFYIHPTPSAKQWFVDKQFTPKWYDCNDDQLKCIVDECVYWDGSVGEGNRLGSYFTSKKVEADFIQFALTRLGFRATISLNNGTKTEHDSYRVRWTTQNVHGLSTATIEDYKPLDGKSYCFTVPSGLLILRRNGKIFITGNCANFMVGLSRTVSLLCRAGVDIMTIKDQLDSTGVCPSYATRKATHHDTSKGSCCPMAIGNALVDMYNEMQSELDDDSKDNEEKPVKKIPVEPISKVNMQQQLCPECGEPLVHIGGCVSCPNCAWTKCE